MDDHLERLRACVEPANTEEVRLLAATLTEREFEALAELLAGWRAGKVELTRERIRACLEW